MIEDEGTPSGSEGGGGQTASQLKTDNIVLNLNTKKKNNVDTAILNLGVEEGTIKPVQLSGSIQVLSTFRASLTLELEIPYVDASGVLSVPQRTPTSSGKVLTLNIASGRINIPKRKPWMTGRAIDLNPLTLSGVLQVPKREAYAEGKIVWKTAIFRGLENGPSSSWKTGNPIKSDKRSTMQKAKVLRADNVARWQFSTPVTVDKSGSFGNTARFTVSAIGGYHAAIPLRVSEVSVLSQQGIPVITQRVATYHGTLSLSPVDFNSLYTKMIPVDRLFTSEYQGTVSLYRCLGGGYHANAIKISTASRIPWQQATPMSREGFTRTVIPWKPPVKQPYQGSTTLNLICGYRGRSDNIYLNLAVNRCYTRKSIGSRSVYVVLNEIIVQRAIDGKAINPTAVRMSTDRDSWCWSFNMTVSKEEMENLKTVGSELPLIRIILNNKLFVFLIESKKRSRTFGETTFNISGRSVTALLDSPHASRRTYTQPGMMNSVQLVEQELERIPDSTILLDWMDFVSRNGWVLPEGALSYSNLTPIEAIKEIVTPVGGTILSDPALPMIKIKARTPYGHWETPAIKTSIPEDIIQQDSSDWIGSQSANAVYVYSSSVSLAGRIIRQGSAGDVIAEQLTSRMYTDAESIREAGRNKLIESNPRELTQYSTAMYEELGIPELCDTLEITSDTGSFWGTVDSIEISVAVSNEVTTIDLSVGIERFLDQEGIDL